MAQTFLPAHVEEVPVSTVSGRIDGLGRSIGQPASFGMTLEMIHGVQLRRRVGQKEALALEGAGEVETYGRDRR